MVASPKLFAPTLCTADSFRWLDPRGRSWLTIVAKISLTLVADGTASIGPAPGLFAADRLHGLGAPDEIEVPTDRVPFLRRPEVVVTGFAFAPPATRVSDMLVSVALRGEGRGFEKRVRAVGEQGDAGSRRPFSSLPLTWSRSVAGPENPAGVFSPDDASIVSADDPRRAAGLGPIAPDWPTRERHAFGLVREALEEPVLRIDPELDTRFFQAAPSDQWIDSLRGPLELTLRGLSPTKPLLATRLPELKVGARIEGPCAAQTLELVPDRLIIDATHHRATLSFRAAVLAEGQDLETWKVALIVQRDGVVERADVSDGSTARPHVLGASSSAEHGSASHQPRLLSGVRPAAREEDVTREGAATRAKLG
ncbi:MAG: DUF2169 domain-containing protein [Polyangiaceae bacterium]|nr:DUF2169 domain-containing protein [Polyangiaceae bacterium]